MSEDARPTATLLGIPVKLSHAWEYTGDTLVVGQRDVEAALKADRARIIEEIDGLVDLNPGGYVVNGGGSSVDKAEYVGALLGTVKALVGGWPS